MAQVDVTELLADPDFIDPLILILRTSTINSKGENVLTEEVINTHGSVQSVSGKDLKRLPEALQTADIRSFYIRQELSANGSEEYPDIIVFQSVRFQIKSANPWMNWGAGWSKGICVVESPAA